MHISRIDLNLFVVFEAIYSEGSITRAAEVLHLTQPAVSHALGRLREVLSDDLFIRTAKGMRPTPYADQLIGTVRQSLNQLQRGLQQSVEFSPERLNTQFRLSVRDMFEALLLPELIRNCRHAAPEVTFSCTRVPREQLLHDLASGRVDVAADILLGHDESIVHEKLSQDHQVCLLRKEHPALNRDWSLAEMLKWPHALVSSREHGPGYEDVQLSRHGLQRKIGLRTPHFFSAALVVAQSDLVLCAPQRFAEILHRRLGLVIKPFPMTLAPLELYLYWHHSLDQEPAHRWLREQVKQAMGNIHWPEAESPDE
ncbi:LysR family transcriptional regulator [Hahella sp. CCB-MM4]|uniref:LysR family transcriptional regulator n=1 Tax=Hahella sp. (strain CCB-MM4) TaxID=1926491 RepID=UPI000B9B5E0C|nr:LysR family transcriptional regulator [Hahella sp. CCB-MM4]OZG74562.1 LysR family transcriptional regulator [Hahella sp. CCB-MM4]